MLGTISLPEEKIRAIKPAHQSGSQAENSRQPGGSAGVQKIDQMQNRMLNDPETVRLIEELQNNPSVQQILQDEELMKAIAEGNLNRLSEDPKIKALMKDKTIGEIIEKNQ
jgi:ubiquinone biosynthesis protein Coq4